jgi:hypothetical protein
MIVRHIKLQYIAGVKLGFESVLFFYYCNIIVRFAHSSHVGISSPRGTLLVLVNLKTGTVHTMYQVRKEYCTLHELICELTLNSNGWSAMSGGPQSASQAYAIGIGITPTVVGTSDSSSIVYFVPKE